MSRVTVASDNWNRTAGGIEVGNSNWQQENSGFASVNTNGTDLGAGTPAPASNKAHASWIGAGTWAADCWAESRIVAWSGFDTTAQAAAACRFTTTGGFNLYQAQISAWGGSISGAATEIMKEVAGVSTQLSFVTGNADGWVNNDVISIEAVGTTISVFKNGVLLRSVTDSDVSGVSSRGVTTGGGDDWAAGTFSAGAAAKTPYNPVPQLGPMLAS